MEKENAKWQKYHCQRIHTKELQKKNEDMKSEGLLITYKYHRKWNQKEESSYSIETENKTKITHNRLN